MGRTVSSPTTTAANATVTKPGFLVELRLSTLFRFASRGDTPWNSFTWAASDLKVGDVEDSPDGTARLSLAVGNTDLAFGAIVLADSALQGRGVSIWYHYPDAVGGVDPVKLFEGVVDAGVVTHASVGFTLTTALSAATFLPRRRITPASGFTRLMPAGRVIQIGNQQIRLERD